MSARAVRLTKVDIDNALANAHLETVFQPIKSFADDSVLRHEVFVRWDHPGLGNLPPGAFIQFFEAQGRIGELTRYVLERAIDCYLQWEDRGNTGLSINLSLSDLTDPTLPADIEACLHNSGVPASRLVLECPPISPEMMSLQQLDSYERLAATGCELALEVRSRDTSGMQVLDPFPFAEIKTGGNHILRYARSSRGGPGLSALSELIQFARSKNARVIAVGVEDEGTAAALKAVGFDAGQGQALGRTGPLGGKVSMPNPNEFGEGSIEDFDMDSDVSLDQDRTVPLDLSEVENAADTASASKRARIVAAKRAALRRFQAAQEAHKAAEAELAEQKRLAEERKAAMIAADTARLLQKRLENSFEQGEALSADELPQALALDSDLRGIAVTTSFVEGLRLDGYGAKMSTTLTSPLAGAVASKPAPPASSKKTSKSVQSLLDELPIEIVDRPSPPLANKSSILGLDEMTAEKVSVDVASHEPDEAAPEIAGSEPAHAEVSGQNESAIPFAELDPSCPVEKAIDEAGLQDISDEDLAPPAPEAESLTYGEADDDVFAEDLVAPNHPNQQGFLNRKYRITHFWPRSWRRALRRMKANRRRESLFEGMEEA